MISYYGGVYSVIPAMCRMHELCTILYIIEVYLYARLIADDVYNIVAQLSLASKVASNGYTPYYKINKLGMHIRKEMWLT